MLDSLRNLISGQRPATSRKNAFCWFCRKSYVDVGPLVEGPEEVLICRDCAALCVTIIDQERQRRLTEERDTNPSGS